MWRHNLVAIISVFPPKAVSPSSFIRSIAALHHEPGFVSLTLSPSAVLLVEKHACLCGEPKRLRHAPRPPLLFIPPPSLFAIRYRVLQIPNYIPALKR